MEFSAILAAVQSGKADLGAGSIIISEERAQAVDFSPYDMIGVVECMVADIALNSKWIRSITRF